MMYARRSVRQLFWDFTGDATVYQAQVANGLMVALKKSLDDDCVEEGLARELSSAVQRARYEPVVSCLI